ncbi:MAG: dTDP-4-amino-4,6-dideoxygalactose transaminase [Gammaproteobacteria bacterium]|nr:dTDP-4-amino-4,6-dideoxygalactose transaminase [Gammaproteobacteria bacterium]
MKIDFNRPFATGKEFEYIRSAISTAHLSGNGQFTKKCQVWLEQQMRSRKALLTHSCTAALEMAAILADIKPGDEVIMPSFTFVSTANAFVLRGGVPVFVDIRPDTLNLDESKVEAAVTPKTRAIAPVHYAGVGCDMDAIMAVARRHDLIVVEDAAQCILSNYKNRPLGSIGHLGALSFHETKNIISGEGGALLVNDERFMQRAEIIWEKGTNRSQFFRGQVDKYTWVDIGSSFLPSEILAAFLWAQMEDVASITEQRLAIWNRYHAKFAEAEKQGLFRRPVIPADCTNNAHMYYLLARDHAMQMRILQGLKAKGIQAVFHYIPLHSAPAGRKYGRAHGSMQATDRTSETLVRLPMWVGLEDRKVDEIAASVIEISRQ